MNQVLVVDVESTCWEPQDSKPPREVSEIIEIGISVVDINKLKILSNESILVRPQRSTQSDFCINLTSITPDMLTDAITYTQACQKLMDKYKSFNKTMISWGDYDRTMFNRCCSEYRCQYPFGKRHLNLKNTFTVLHGLDREPGMDKALEMLNLPLDGTHHRGGDDANNIAKIFIHTLAKFRGI